MLSPDNLFYGINVIMTDEQKAFIDAVNNTCKVIVIGNVGQCDLPNPTESGFKPYMDFFADDPRVATVKLSKCYRGWFAEKAEQLALR